MTQIRMKVHTMMIYKPIGFIISVSDPYERKKVCASMPIEGLHDAERTYICEHSFSRSLVSFLYCAVGLRRKTTEHAVSLDLLHNRI